MALPTTNKAQYIYKNREVARCSVEINDHDNDVWMEQFDGKGSINKKTFLLITDKSGTRRFSLSSDQLFRPPYGGSVTLSVRQDLILTPATKLVVDLTEEVEEKPTGIRIKRKNEEDDISEISDEEESGPVSYSPRMKHRTARMNAGGKPMQ